jgi:hypothetical protein
MRAKKRTIQHKLFKFDKLEQKLTKIQFKNRRCTYFSNTIYEK